MDATYHVLAKRALKKHETIQANANHSCRLLIALAGAPGSGKTTIATRVAALINSTPEAPVTIVVGMDGYHLSRDVLDRMPNRAEAYVRRGAPWTFDAQGVVDLVKRCRSGRETILAPTFDHAVKDPVRDGLEIPRSAGIIIFEGLYLLLDEEPWSQIGALMDDRWYMHVDPAVAKERVAARHVAAGIEPDLESGRRRVEMNDEINGRFIAEHSRVRDITILSVESQRT